MPPAIDFTLPDRAGSEAIRQVEEAAARGADPDSAFDLVPGIRALVSRSSPAGHNVSGPIEAGGRDYFAKVYGSAGDWAREFAVRKLLAEDGAAHVFPVMLTGVVDLGWDRWTRFSLFPVAEGRPLPRRPSAGERGVYRSVGGFARRLHRIRTSSGRARFRLRHNQMFDLDPIEASGVFSAAEWRRLEEAIANSLAQAGDDGDSLVHNDLGTGGNVIAEPGTSRLMWVVDFELAHFGFRTTDLLWIDCDAPACAGAFRDGYGGDSSLPQRAVMRLFRAFSELLEDVGYQFMRPFGQSHPISRERALAEAERRVRSSSRLPHLLRAAEACLR
ncbi:MAG TPA: aminoglycoside phosphotransferase family protein [Propylenella sp.]|nr:aminoglycoside phosphotransferase family protein [Propylenella sp.]